ncbi:claspin-like [Thrips palmi]|uniref:Claspin-like n=1 Tax=Thrips palmi TaxID=161013 RepID=A0A6P8YGK5_THRPL|nr:claspin-like [Thrips palmi]
MDSSSEDESVFNRRKSSSKKIFDSDDEAAGEADDNLKEATEDFTLHLSDEEDDEDGASVKANIEAALAQEEASAENAHDVKEDSKDESRGDSSRLDNKEMKSNAAQKSINPSGNLDTADIMKKLSALADSDSESDIDGDLEPLPTSIKKSNSKSKSCIASESDDSGNERSQSHSDDETKEAVLSSKGKQRKSAPERKSKTKAKDAMLEIKAESQRQLRQSNIGLPYHVPKQRSLLDFLNRRKPASSMPIRGPVEQLATVWKQIEDREKEVEDFYKSESEHESDEEETTQEVEQSEEGTEPAEQVEGKSLDPSQSDTHQLTTAVLGDSGVEADFSGAQSSTEPNSDIIDDTESEQTTSICCQESMDFKTTTEVDTDRVQSPVGTDFCVEENSSGVSPDDACAKKVQEVDEFPVKDDNVKIGNETQDSQDISLHFTETERNTQGILKTQESQDITLHFSETERNVEGAFKTQDSQDISLHYTETESLIKTDLKGVTKENHLTNEIAVMENSSNAGNKPKGSTWEELNSAMKDLDDDDLVSHEIVPKKLSLGSGPRLSLKGAPNDVIDLDGSVSNPRTPGVKGLIERFMKHSASKRKEAQTVELSVISSEKDTIGGVVDVKHESLKVVLTAEEPRRSEKDATPGARLKLLKTELNRQMRKQKGEEWQKKHEEMKNEQVFDGEKDDCGMLPDEEEEEEEMTDSEAESEPEINDVRESKKKKKVKSAYVDEEAEVSEEDGGDRDVDERESSDDESVDEGDDEGSGSEDDNNKHVDDTSVDDETSKSKIDSVKESCLAQTENDETSDIGPTNSLRRTLTSASADLFASQSSVWRVEDDDDFIPAGQPNGVTRDYSFMDRADDGKEREMLFSPMSLTLPEKTHSFMDTSQELTPQKTSIDPRPQSSLKKLFGETQIYSTQDKLKEIAGLFADKFNDSQDNISDLANVSTGESETDLMALCSGKFVTQPPKPKDLEEDEERVPDSQLSQTQPATSWDPALENGDSVDFSLKFDGDSKNPEDIVEKPNECAGNFRLEIMSSDDEDNTTLTKEKKKKRKKLEFSDDEDDDNHKSDTDLEENEINSDEEEKEKEEKNSKLFGIFSKPSKEIFYDSDENEIEPGDFLEKEAELSEEDEYNGSDDEDEKGLDQLEMNEADKEDIDQDLVREQLVKSHMQKMLDEDRRDVRILQEMLLEDGELHSDNGGRERQFRWKNVDSTGMGDDGHRSDDEHADNDDEEDDAAWRKQRHEREMFLREQREKQKKEAGGHKEDDDEDEVLENSELLQLGKSILFKNRSSSLDMSAPKETQPPKLTAHNPVLSPERKTGNTFLSKRGSFLSRGDGVLAKLAKMTGPAKENVMSGAKSRGNFVFSAISPPKYDSQPEEDDSKTSKRKATAGLMNAEKKPCLVTAARKSSGLFDHF